MIDEAAYGSVNALSLACWNAIPWCFVLKPWPEKPCVDCQAAQICRAHMRPSLNERESEQAERKRFKSSQTCELLRWSADTDPLSQCSVEGLANRREGHGLADPRSDQHKRVVWSVVGPLYRMLRGCLRISIVTDFRHRLCCGCGQDSIDISVKCQS